MNVSTLVKILIALFLGVFLWVIITNIQAPVAVEQTNLPREQLRDELLGIAEDVTINVGDLTIVAETQETYRNGEVHYQNFTMTQSSEKREMTIVGRTAQTKSEGTDISFLVLNGDVVVDTNDGLHLETEALNYESNRDRIFTQEETVFTLNELTGRCNRFLFELNSKRLEMTGDVQANYLMAAEENGERERRIDIQGRKVIYDQTEHILLIDKRGVIFEGGSFIRGDSIRADLSADNSQFIRMNVERARTRGMPEFGSNQEEESAEEDSEAENTEEESQPKGDANLSHHASGIKNIEADTMLMEFTTGESNLLRKVTAIGTASMEITPTGRIRRDGSAEYKKITGDQITASIDTENGGLKGLNVTTEDGFSRMEQRPLFINPTRSKQADLPRKDKPRFSSARNINMTMDPASNLIKSMVLQRDVTVSQGDLKLTADNCNYQSAAGTMVLTGDPVLEDSVKRVSGQTMTVNMLIDDLAASGNVSSQFYKIEDQANSEARSVFSIGKEGGETLIQANSLRLDYSNNILRYRDGVTINQGNTVIRSEKLDIHQVEERLIAIGGVKADLTYENISAEREDEEETNKKKINKGVFLSGEYLEINKDQRFVRVRNKAKAVQNAMTISAEEIGYTLDEEDRIIKSTARRGVKIDLNGPMIEGDTATIDPAKELLIVVGRLVTFVDPAGMSGDKYRKIEFDMNTGAMKFYGEANEPISTTVLGMESDTK